MTDHWMLCSSPVFLSCLYISLMELPVVEQEYCGYWVKATARVTPSRFISARHSSVSGFAYRKATYGLWGAVSGLSSSRILTIPAPCSRVHLRMGEPPPIFAYCSSILGVLRRAISGAMVDWKGSGMRSPS